MPDRTRICSIFLPCRDFNKRRLETMQMSSSRAWRALILTQLLLRGKKEAVGHPEQRLRVFYCSVSNSALHLHEAGITETMTTAVTIKACNLLFTYCCRKVRCVASISHVDFQLLTVRTRHQNNVYSWGWMQVWCMNSYISAALLTSEGCPSCAVTFTMEKVSHI